MYSNEDVAIEKIKGYLNVTGNPKWTKEYVLSNYGIAVQLLVEKAESYKVMPGVKSFSEGGQSMTFSDEGKWTITDDIKELLPAPFVKLMGWDIMGVLFKNADITLYNKYYDKENDVDRYQRVVIREVNWQGKRNATVGDKGLNRDDSILIFIDKIFLYIVLVISVSIILLLFIILCCLLTKSFVTLLSIFSK